MRFGRSHSARLFAAGLLAAGTLSLTAAAGPAAADVVEPFGPRYQGSPYGGFATIGNTVTGCPTAPADPAARCAAAAKGEGRGGSTAETGAGGERLWLLCALAVVLGATGLVAKAAMRGRRD
ncbi:hypothetical protein SNE510_71720 [Streptomyces sp. NE5-10]|uniref:hypothetical protein n=1 Tax=Streptomyces sp. NE5-10 TaxID=2759674 RepID=UPI0019039DDA|nr:hypothetical protein [Streptomyces sp. NE5-10]GHJ97653.1 hypothetical protein SNE510_71720 [Streptomyces sp. NE5-10]